LPLFFTTYFLLSVNPRVPVRKPALLQRPGARSHIQSRKRTGDRQPQRATHQNSHDRALYAFRSQVPVGVDIEKIRNHYNDAIAERFFSPEEYAAFFQSVHPSKNSCIFLKFWTGKEALVKALGEGLSFPLSSFSIPGSRSDQEIQLTHQSVLQIWY